jgi:hypothetical protein
VPKEIKDIKEDCPKTKEMRETEGTNLRRTEVQVLRNHVSLSSKLLQKHTHSPIWLKREPLSTYMGKHPKHPSPNALNFIFSLSEQQSDSSSNTQKTKKNIFPPAQPNFKTSLPSNNIKATIEH